MRYRSVALILPVLLATVVNCGGELPPEPGVLNVSLGSPATDDGGVLMTIRGAVTGQIAPADTSYDVFVRRISTTESRVIVVGNLQIGNPLLEIGVPDVNRLGDYSATVEQVTDRGNDPRADVSRYTVSFNRNRSTPSTRADGVTGQGM